MANFYELTPRELEGIIAYVRDNDTSVLQSDAIGKFMNLSSVLGKKLRDDAIRNARRAETAESRLQKIREKDLETFKNEEIPGTGIDSLPVAIALLYQLQVMKASGLTKKKLNYILYRMYAEWLAGHDERLVTEHPVATPWGPFFWRVENQIKSTTLRVSYDDWKNFAFDHPAIAGFIKTYAGKHGNDNEKDMKEFLMSSKPYRNSKPKKGGKWNAELSDHEIREWKLSLK